VISRDNHGLGRTAALLLLEGLRGEPARRVELPTSFVPAGSCARAPR